MKFFAGSLVIAVVAISRLAGATQEEPRLLAKVTSLPVAWNKDLEFRKTKLYFLSEQLPRGPGQRAAASLKGNAAW